ncbi:Holliday junction resolvase RuvX [Faecalispora anaeroviscerum]|uniref:Holliday junction resolvase RuvX n=1 Tax=Faecalispora anaeroviscerum TaxID=2991836 RepID=UPI0024B8CB6A|nr:Holliday junction resolvase RuvX [Faecalispora anaeroviscerum]
MKILAVDLGKARTGLAVCDEGELLASPLAVVQEHNAERLCRAVAEAAREQNAKLLVVGLPRNMDGSEGESAQNARAFGAKLEQESGVPVVFCDERGTTITAHNYLNATDTRGKRRKAVVDAVAATIILDNYLAYRKNRK